MEYSQSARDVITALRDARGEDGAVDWVRAIQSLAELFPFSALGYALHQGDVWPREARLRASQGSVPACGSFFLEEFVEAAETGAAADGAQVVSEAHLAKAIAKLVPDLTELGVSIDTLVIRAEERVGFRPGVIVPKRPRVVGAARADLLAAAVAEQSLDAVLDREERSRTVERKRSVLNDQASALAAHEQAAVALVNGNPETPVYLIFGQEDDGTILGEVDHEGRPMRPEAVQKCQRRLDKRLQACVPPVSMRWESIGREGRTVWIACLIGRARGTAHRTSAGAYPYRSGEDTHFASPELITAWLREPAGPDTDADGVQGEDLVAPGPSMAPTRSATIPRDDPGAEQRVVLARLHKAVEDFTAAPPDIPRSVQGHTLDAWRPVFEPILGVFRPAMDEVVEHGIMADIDGLTRIGRGVRSVFRLDHRRSGLTWIVEAPRLITRLIADRLLVDAYCSEDWRRLLAVARHPFDSYVGRVPWVLAPEYRHPETLGRNAQVAGELTIVEVIDHAQRLKDTGVSDSGLRGACGALNLAFVVCAMAREDAMGRARDSQWVTPTPELSAEVAGWDEQRGLLEALAVLAGEEYDVFSTQLPDRLSRIEQTLIRHGQFFFAGFGGGARSAFDRIAAEFRTAT